MGATDIKLKIGADDSALTKKLKGLHNKIAKMAAKVERVGRKLTTNVTLPLVAFAAGTLQSLASIDKLKKGLIGIMGDAKKAGVEFQRLRKLSKGAGLDLQSTIQGSVRLQAIGYDADKAADQIKILANAVALVGGSGQDLSGVTLAITQILSKGKVHAEEINQMAERMPQVRKAMMDAFGTADTEILQRAGITAENFVDGIVGELGRLPKAQKTVADRFKQMRDELNLVAANIGTELMPIVMKLGGLIIKLAGAWSNLSSAQKGGIVGMAAAAAAAGPLITAFGKIMKVFSALMKFALMNPFTALITGLVVGAVLIVKNWDKVRTFIVKVANVFIDLYNNSLNFRATVEGIKLAFNMVWTTVKLMGKNLMNMFSTLGGALKAIFKGNFREVADILKSGTDEHKEILKAAGEEYGEALNTGMQKTFRPIPAKHITESDVDTFFEPIVTGAKKVGDKVSALLKSATGGGGGGDAGTEGYVQNLGAELERKSKVYSGIVDTIIKLSSKVRQIGGGAEDNLGDAAVQKALSTMQVQLQDKKDPFDFLGASFEETLGKAGEVGFKSFWAAAVQEGPAAMASVVATVAQAVGGMLNEVSSVVDGFYDNKLQRIENTYEREAALINASGASEEAKATRIARLEEATDKKRKVAMRNQAKAAKAAAIFQSIIAGVLAVNQALTAGPYAGPILATVVGGIAAANTAVIASEPLPQLAAGGIVSGRSAVEVAEYAGARFNPEVIAPLDKLEGMMGGKGAVNIKLMGGWKVSGADLETVMRAQQASRSTLTA